MAERSVSVRLRAEVSGYMASMRAASRATSDFMGRTLDRADKSRAAFETVGGALTRFGAVAVGALALSTKAAIDWESAWVGVQKTVDGTTPQMAALEAELREMSKTLPITHEEIAGVAAAAGQLGVKREDIAGFAKTMIDLGQSTNLASEEAATAIARFSNIMGTSHSEVDRLGSALVELGNNSATTEAEIMQMAARMAGAGNLIGATEADVLAMATALSSIGIEAEAGGGSMSRIMQQIYASVQDGGERLQKFAKIAGMTASEFARSFKSDPVAAINEFVQGLNRVESSGGNVVAALKEVGIRGTEDMRTVLGLKGATDLLSESLGLASDAWRENTALTDEADQRYGTAASKIKMAWNTVKDAAITVGEAVAPVVTFLAESIGAVVGVFTSLPGPVQAVIGVLGGLAGAAALVTGAALLLLPRIADTRRAMAELNITGGRLRNGMSRVGGALSTAGDAIRTHWRTALVGVGLVLAEVIRQVSKIRPDIEAMSSGLERFANTGKMTGEVARVLGDDIDDLSYAIDAVNSNNFDKAITSVIEGVTGLVGYAPFDEAKQRIEGLDSSLSDLVKSGNASTAATAIERLSEATGKSVGEIKKALPGYTAALEVASDEAKKAGKSSGDAAKGIDEVGVSAAEAAEEVAELVDSISDLNSEFYDARSAARAYEQALDDANETISENGKSLDITTQAGRENQAALDDLAKSAMEAAEATLKEAESNGELSRVLPDVIKKIQQQRSDWISAAQAAGMNKKEAESLANQLFRLPPEVATHVKLPGISGAISKIGQFLGLVNSIPISRTLTLSAIIPGPALMAMQAMRQLGLKDGGLVGYSSGGLVGFPTGGMVRGPGGPRTDSIAAALSTGEFVVNAEATQNNRDLLEAINSGRVTSSGVSREVSGVRSTPPPSSSSAGVTLVVNAPNYVGPASELLTTLRREVSRSFGGNVQAALGR